MVLVADKASVQKILVEEDLGKAPAIADLRAHRDIPSLLTEVYKASHKRSVKSAQSLIYEACVLTIMPETTSIIRLLSYISQWLGAVHAAML